MGYKKYNIYEGASFSPKLLSFGIIIGIAVLTAMIVIGSRAGLTATFESGGETFSEQHLRYGEKIKEPPSPTRVGYSFAGWYKDSEGKEKFDFANEKLQDDIILYAKWQKRGASNSSSELHNKNKTQKQILY